jgi:hypothetical protein
MSRYHVVAAQGRKENRKIKRSPDGLSELRQMKRRHKHTQPNKSVWWFLKGLPKFLVQDSQIDHDRKMLYKNDDPHGRGQSIGFASPKKHAKCIRLGCKRKWYAWDFCKVHYLEQLPEFVKNGKWAKLIRHDL